MFTLLNTLNKTHKGNVLDYAFMVVENALAKEKGCYISDARYELDDLYLERDRMLLEAFAPPNMYAMNKSGIAFLTTMIENIIENEDGRDISGPREELIKLIDEQIALVEDMRAYSLNKAEEWNELLPDMLEECEKTKCEYLYDSYLFSKKETEEEERKAEMYLNDLKLLHKQKKIQLCAKHTKAIEVLTDEMENLTGSDLSLAIDKQNGLIADNIPLLKDLHKDAIEEGSWKADLFRAELRILYALLNINDELKKCC